MAAGGDARERVREIAGRSEPGRSEAAPRPAAGLRFRRVVLKLSGEALQGEAGGGIDNETVERASRELAAVHALGAELAIVVGGGNILRGATASESGVDRVAGDHMGMLATVINALALQDALERRGVATRVLTAIEMREVAEPYVRRRAIRHLEKGRVVIFGAGTGNPFFTTDSAAALRASEIGADALLKATQVDGVYTADPKEDPSAERLPTLTYQYALDHDLKVMDTAAFSLCRDNDLPIVVFELAREGNIGRVVTGDESVGSLVASEERLERLGA